MKVIKLYLKYQLTTSNVLIFLFLILFLSTSYFISCYDLNYSLSYDDILKLYFDNSLYYSKIIFIFMSCFLFMKLKNERNEYLINIVITAGYSKKYNFMGMIISNLVLILFVVTILFMSFILIGFINMKFFSLNKNFIISYFNLILLSIHYGLLTYLIIQITNNQMFFILILIMFLLSDLVINMNNEIKLFYLCVFPNINNINGSLYLNTIYALCNVIVLIIINLIIYLKNDLRG